MSEDENRQQSKKSPAFAVDSESTAKSSGPPKASVSSAKAAASSVPSDDLTIARAMQAIETLTSLYGFSVGAANEAIEYANATTNNGDDLVALCCDYILDQGLGIDSGGAIAPIDNCPHVVIEDAVVAEGEESSSHVTEKGESNAAKTRCCISVTAEDVPESIFEMPCGYFGETKTQAKTTTRVGGFKDDIEYSESGGGATCPVGENWWCLRCGGIYCSRYVNGHGVQHYNERKEAEHCVMIGLADLSVWCHKCGAYLQTQHNEKLSSILNRLQDIKFRDEKH
jgi:hypothetical protein